MRLLAHSPTSGTPLKLWSIIYLTPVHIPFAFDYTSLKAHFFCGLPYHWEARRARQEASLASRRCHRLSFGGSGRSDAATGESCARSSAMACITRVIWSTLSRQPVLVLEPGNGLKVLIRRQQGQIVAQGHRRNQGIHGRQLPATTAQ
jgi:hypothetical protein